MEYHCEQQAAVLQVKGADSNQLLQIFIWFWVLEPDLAVLGTPSWLFAQESILAPFGVPGIEPGSDAGWASALASVWSLQPFKSNFKLCYQLNHWEDKYKAQQ